VQRVQHAATAPALEARQADRDDVQLVSVVQTPGTASMLSCTCRLATYKGHPCRHIFRVGQAINELDLDLRLVARRWKRMTEVETESVVMGAIANALELASLADGVRGRSVSAAGAWGEEQRLRTFRTLTVLARDLVSRAANDGPDASRLVEDKLREARILLDHYEQDGRARDSAGDESTTIRNPPVIKSKGRPRMKRIRSVTEQAAAAAKRVRVRSGCAAFVIEARARRREYRASTS
jgi:hypothetical protein